MAAASGPSSPCPSPARSMTTSRSGSKPGARRAASTGAQRSSMPRAATRAWGTRRTRGTGARRSANATWKVGPLLPVGRQEAVLGEHPAPCHVRRRQREGRDHVPDPEEPCHPRRQRRGPARTAPRAHEAAGGLHLPVGVQVVVEEQIVLAEEDVVVRRHQLPRDVVGSQVSLPAACAPVGVLEDDVLRVEAHDPRPQRTLPPPRRRAGARPRGARASAPHRWWGCGRRAPGRDRGTRRRPRARRAPARLAAGAWRDGPRARSSPGPRRARGPTRRGADSGCGSETGRSPGPRRGTDGPGRRSPRARAACRGARGPRAREPGARSPGKASAATASRSGRSPT